MDALLVVIRWAALAPLAYLLVFRRTAPAAYWICALGFAVSFVADLIALGTRGSWLAVPWYQVFQFGLFALALGANGGRDMLLPVAAYVLLGTAFYLPMVKLRADYGAFMALWYPYQATRLASFGLFVRAAWRA